MSETDNNNKENTSNYIQLAFVGFIFLSQGIKWVKSIFDHKEKKKKEASDLESQHSLKSIKEQVTTLDKITEKISQFEQIMNKIINPTADTDVVIE